MISQHGWWPNTFFDIINYLCVCSEIAEILSRLLPRWTSI